MTLATLPFSRLLDRFAAAEPTPGGGSAAALAGAVGVALLAMVAGMSKTRHGDEADRAELAAASEPLLHARDHLAALVDRDSEAYDAVVAAYRQPKATPAEQAARTAAIRAALRGATEVPLDVMRAAHAAVVTAAVVGRHGNPNARSDIGVALELLHAAYRGASLNVGTNLATTSDDAYVAAIEAEVSRLDAAFGDALEEARTALA